MMRLVWRMPPPAIVLQWRGPDARILAAQIANPIPNPQTPLAAIIGPPGMPGAPGAQGPAGPAYNWDTAVIDAGTYN
jgi:hypothetical protein